MIRRAVAGAAVLALVGGACGLGDKQAQAERIVAAGRDLMRSESIAATLSVNVRVLPVERQLVAQEPPRITEGRATGLEAVIRPGDNAAVVAENLRFVKATMYERIVPAAARVSSPAAAVVPSNLNVIAAGLTAAPATSTTTTTTAPVRSLRRTVQIVREWAAFDFADIPDNDTTKHGGSLAVNPVAVLRLTTGVLTGSVETTGNGVVRANVSRDKAERKLSEQQREVLDKMFTANAITRRVFPAVFGFAPDGNLASFEVTLRQQLSSKDRADLTLGFAFRGEQPTVVVSPPPRRGTVTVRTLGQLVTTASGL